MGGMGIRSRWTLVGGGVALSAGCALLWAQGAGFRGAPAAAAGQKNPLARQHAAVMAGAATYQQSCSACHGASGQGTGNIPPLNDAPVRSASDGALFWFITNGSPANGMPAWKQLPETKRWQLVAYLKSMDGKSVAAAPAAAAGPAKVSHAPAPKPPFTDWRYERPGLARHIRLADVPGAMPAEAANATPKVVARPKGAWPKVPAGFKVTLYAEGLNNPRLMRMAPNGDIFITETAAGNIKIFRGMKDGKPEQTFTFATGLKTPFGMAFYPAVNPQWLYVADEDALLRFPYKSGDTKASGAAQKLDSIPGGGHHRSRDVLFSPDGKKMYVSVGSQENVDDGAAKSGEADRADILEYNPDGTGKRVWASGLRNPVSIVWNPKTKEMWTSVNERDGLGNNLVPDYLTHVQPGGFYGWPWWWMGNQRDDRAANPPANLQGKVITPDVILQPHGAPLGFEFYEGKNFPAQYQRDIFLAEHGSWNRLPRAGYELVRVPLHGTGHATGEYEDFMTGFVVDEDSVWGRPVGVITAADGSLLVSDDGSGSVWRITYTGKR
jgi:glucose/arabinose dehydrogenase